MPTLGKDIITAEFHKNANSLRDDIVGNPFTSVSLATIGVCVFCAQLRLRTFLFWKGENNMEEKTLEEYEILDVDYDNSLFADAKSFSSSSILFLSSNDFLKKVLHLA